MLLPSLTRQLGGFANLGLCGSVHLLSASAGYFLFEFLYTRLRGNLTYILSLQLFGIGSLTLAISDALPAIVIGRSCIGLGSAGMHAGVEPLLETTGPRYLHPGFYWTISAFYGIGQAFGFL